MNNSVEKTLEERGGKYGPFSGHADVTQRFKNVVVVGFLNNKEYLCLQPEDAHVVREALDMICHKIGRIVNGDPTYDDSWRDIAGYATLVEKHFNREQDNEQAD